MQSLVFLEEGGRERLDTNREDKVMGIVRQRLEGCGHKPWNAGHHQKLEEKFLLLSL